MSFVADSFPIRAVAWAPEHRFLSIVVSKLVGSELAGCGYCWGYGEE